MPTVRVKLTELVDGEAQFISIVGKGANRQPFKILKSEEQEEHEPMPKTSWTNLFHNVNAVQKSEISPEILAILVAPGVDVEAVKALILKADLNADDIREFQTEDGKVTAFIQKSDVEPGAGGDYETVVQLTDGVSAVCLVAKKSFQPFAGSTSFAENMQSQGFFPGVHLAQSVLEDTLFEISFKADSPSEMAEKVKIATEEFSAAVQAMTAVLPASVFKFEDIVRKGSLTGGPSAGEDPVSGRGDTGEPAKDALSNEKGSGSSIEPMSNVQKAGHVDDEVSGKGKKKDGKDAKKDDAVATANAEGDEKKEKAKEDPMVDLTKLITGLGDALKEGLSGVQKQVTDLGARVDAAEATATNAGTVAKKAETATRGRVSAGAPEDDTLQTTRQKGESAAFREIPLLDTAYGAVPD